MYLNLGSILLANANEKANSVVIRAGDREITYQELDRAARGVATSLRARGVSPGDKVALLVPNVPEFTIAYFGILYAGATVVPINVLAAAPEVTYFLEDSGARVLFVHPLFEEPGRAGAASLDVDVILAVPGDSPNTVGGMALGEPKIDPSLRPRAAGMDQSWVRASRNWRSRGPGPLRLKGARRRARWFLVWLRSRSISRRARCRASSLEGRRAYRSEIGRES